MTAIFEPRSSGGDVIGGALALNFDEYGEVGEILAVPLVEGIEQLKSLGLGVDFDSNFAAVSRRRVKRVHAGVKGLWQLIACETQKNVKTFSSLFFLQISLP